MSRNRTVTLLVLILAAPCALARPGLVTLRGSVAAVTSQAVEIPVNLVTEGAPLHAVAMDLHFTAERLRLVDVGAGADLPDGFRVEWNLIDDGHVRLGIVGTGRSLRGGCVARLQFETLQPGSAIVTATCEGADADGASIAMDCETGAVLIEPGALDDADADGVPSRLDNCPQHANAGQDDFDHDGVGDPCDACVHFAPDLLGSGCDFHWGDLAPAGAPDGRVDVADVVRSLRIATARETPDESELRRGNVAPATLSSGEPPQIATPTLQGAQVIDVSDVVLILRTAVGLTQLPRPN